MILKFPSDEEDVKEHAAFVAEKLRVLAEGDTLRGFAIVVLTGDGAEYHSAGRGLEVLGAASLLRDRMAEMVEGE